MGFLLSAGRGGLPAGAGRCRRFGRGAIGAASVADRRRKYRGARFSLGYGACPDLEDRAKIADLL
ncbi:hypothetical protein, partial [Streptomyces celluloflavus]|uniref:hypothetical protein n=1 Tax=Streptomyces celluloflavus TaxID=58344 RepID=UPI0036B31C2C